MRRLTAILVIALVAGALGQSYVLKTCVIDAGGRQAASSSYRAGISFGQPVASDVITSSSYNAILGFWHPGLLIGVREPAVNAALEPSFALGQNVPNPFRDRAIINYSLPAETEVDLKVIDRDGRVVTTLVSSRQKAGRYRITWGLDSRSRAELANGVYFYRLTAGGHTATRKMVKME
jgi:hypothetical protein